MDRKIVFQGQLDVGTVLIAILLLLCLLPIVWGVDLGCTPYF
jgi:hypothetical protein